MKTEEIRRWVVRPILQRARCWNQAAENLVVGTGLIESGYEFLDQRDLGGAPGPAFGPWQIEALTFQSLWLREFSQMTRMNYLQALGMQEIPQIDELHGNLFLGALTCRMKYLTVSEPLPASDNPAGMALYWKKYYNTFLGAGSVAEAFPHFKLACA